MKTFQTKFLSKNSETSEESYYHMLGCVPPRAMVRNAFLVGEADDHGGQDGAPRYGLYFTEGDKYYYGGKVALSEFNAFVHEDKPEPGKQYSLTGGTGDKCIMNGFTWKESQI
jgi:hypothetical protein